MNGDDRGGYVQLSHAADPEVMETIKRVRRPYFTLDGNVCALLAAKAWVNVFLYDGAIVPDPEGIITAGHDNKTARTVAIRQGEKINARALTAMVDRFCFVTYVFDPAAEAVDPIDAAKELALLWANAIGLAI